ncbi:MAG: hypothetical protein EXR21_10445 [Flavobacteriaceae bacterium]|nr:hypothetical protein [Flavobacteriaceae bacterium]
MPKAATYLISIMLLFGFKPDNGCKTLKPQEEDFCMVFFRIIKSAVETNFENMKGPSQGITSKGYNKIEKWASAENLPGYKNGIITKSFGTSFTTNLMSSSELTEAMTKAYDQWAYEIDDCLSPAWQIYNVPQEGFYKKMSISRREQKELLTFPNVNLEVNMVDGKFTLQLRVIK